MAIYVFTVGWLQTPRFMVSDGLALGRTRLPITVALITSPDGSAVLIDGGFSRREMTDPEGELGVQSALMPISATHSDSAVTQVERLGIEPDSVKAIVATHLHLDHVGCYVDFPNAEIIATQAELDSARARGKLGGFMHIEGIVRSGRARPVSLVGGGRHGFPNHLDLFSDGRLLLLDARGHTAGSVAMLVTDGEPSQQVLMIGDAAYISREYRRRESTLMARITAFDKEWHRATWGRIADFESRNFDIPVVPSHCAEALRSLPSHLAR